MRKGRSLEAITPAGGEVIQRARAVLAEANNIRTYSANQRRESQGQLILATTHTQARFVLPPAIGQIKRAYPQVSVHLQQAGESAALDLLSQGDADIAIISTAGEEPQAGIAVPLYARQAPDELAAMMKDASPTLIVCGDVSLRTNILRAWPEAAHGGEPSRTTMGQITDVRS